MKFWLFSLFFLLAATKTESQPEVSPALRNWLQSRSSQTKRILVQPRVMMEKSQTSPMKLSTGKGAPTGKGIPSKKGISSSKGIPGKGKGNSFEGPTAAHPSLDPQLQTRLMQLFEYSKTSFLREIQPLLDSEIKVIDSYWLNQTLLLEGSSLALSELLDRNDIAFMVEDFEIQLSPVTARENNLDFEFPYGLKVLKTTQVQQKLGLTGKGVRVGILDTGYKDHPFLVQKILAARNFSSDSNIEDGHGHGTHCLGSILGSAPLDTEPNRKLLQTGIAPDAKAYVAKVFNNQGRSSLSQIIAGMQWLADPDQNPNTRDQAQIISGSFGESIKDFTQEKPLWDAVLRLRRLGILSVFAAGNEGPSSGTINSPGAFPQSLSIGSIDQKGSLASYSSRGEVEFEDVYYLKPDLVAPGSSVLSLGLDQNFTRMTGTSMSTPYAAGVCALMLEANPDLTVDRLRKIIEVTATDLNEPGPDSDSGYGLINAHQAVKLAMNLAQVKGAVDGVETRAQVSFFHVDEDRKLVQKIETKLTGGFEAYLSAGRYEVVFSAWNRRPVTRVIHLQKGSKLELVEELKPAQLSTIHVQAKDQSGLALPISIRLFDSLIDAKVEELEDFEYQLQVPMGLYYLGIQSQGYLDFSTHFTVDQVESDLQVQLVRVPPLLIVDGDGDSKLESFVSRVINQDFQVVNSKNLKSFQPYQMILWGTGSQGHNNFSEEHRILLRNFVFEGGGLVLHGQDLVYSLQDHPDFLNETLGLSLHEDDSNARQILSGLLQAEINHEHSAANQLFPDSFQLKGEAKTYLQYDNSQIAAVLNHFGNGSVVTLGFGLEGIGDQAREVLLQALLKDLKPNSKQLANRLNHLQQSDKESHIKYLQSIQKYYPQEYSEISQLDTKDSAWQGQGLSTVKFDTIYQKRRKIFEELYNPPEPRTMTY